MTDERPQTEEAEGGEEAGERQGEEEEAPEKTTESGMECSEPTGNEGMTGTKHMLMRTLSQNHAVLTSLPTCVQYSTDLWDDMQQAIGLNRGCEQRGSDAQDHQSVNQSLTPFCKLRELLVTLYFKGL